MIKKIKFLIILISLTFLLGCPNVSTEPNDPVIQPIKITTKISDFAVSKMERKTYIDLSWKSIKGVCKYKIYKYSQPNEESLIKILEFTDNEPDKVTVLKFTDYDFTIEEDINIPFYYRISSVIDSNESEKSDFEYGIFYNEYELKNNNASGAGEYTDKINSVLFSFLDCEGKVINDSDWYKMTCLPKDFMLEIKNKKSMNIKSGDVNIAILYKNTEKVYALDISDNNKTAVCLPEIFTENEANKKIDIYFKIYISKTKLSGITSLEYEILKYSNINSPVSDLTVSKMSTIGKLNLSWTSIKGVKEYKIYKYSKGNEESLIKEIQYLDSSPEKIKKITVTDSDFSLDNDIYKPFFYKISCSRTLGETQQSIESKKSKFCHGVFGETIDPFEPYNNDMPPKNALSSIFDSNHPNIYSLTDNEGKISSDVDWYKLKHYPASFDLNFHTLDSKNVEKGDIVLQFFYNDKFQNKIFKVKPKGITSCFFDFTEESSKEYIDVYFRVSFRNSNSNVNKFLTYTISE